MLSVVEAARVSATDLQIRSLLHELQVHSEEITVQNEQLIKAQHELEHARDRYADLYDFAPIGYLSLDTRGAITEINLAGAALFRRQRNFVLGMPLSAMIARQHRDLLQDFIIRAHQATGLTPPQVEIQLRGDGKRIVRMVARPVQAAGIHQLSVAMVDITEERRLEEERAKALQREQKKTAELQAEVTVRMTAEERIKALLERLVDVQERERRRLALNLHDQLGQQLTALRLTLDALKVAKPGSDDAKKRFDLIEQIVSQLDRDVDFLAWELRPAALDDVGLEAALQEFLRQWSITHGVQLDFHAPLGDAPRLPSDIESHLYRIVQEALNNISKHAKATHVSVLLERRADEVTLIIEDDGRGFDVTAVHRKGKKAGMGLTGMQERASSIGGQLHCESTANKGTTLFVRIPIKVATPERGGGKNRPF